MSVRVAQSWFKRFQSRTDRPAYHWYNGCDFWKSGVRSAYAQWRRGGNTVSYGVARRSSVTPDRLGGVCSHRKAEYLGIEHKTVRPFETKPGAQKARYLGATRTHWNKPNETCTHLDSLLKHNENEPFLNRLITGDEKWITHDKNVQKGRGERWSKPGLTRNKVMLCV